MIHYFWWFWGLAGFSWKLFNLTCHLVEFPKLSHSHVPGFIWDGWNSWGDLVSFFPLGISHHPGAVRVVQMTDGFQGIKRRIHKLFRGLDSLYSMDHDQSQVSLGSKDEVTWWKEWQSWTGMGDIGGDHFCLQYLPHVLILVNVSL
jgi:hypothetical protein